MKRELSKLSGLDYEFTIIGTGPAGISLALGLSQKGKKVLLLEAGEYEYTDKSQQVYEGKIIGPDFGIASRRLRFFGGTSNHWGGMCRPLDDIDFEKFPISKADMDPYLPEASNILEIEGKFRDDLPLNNEFKQIDFRQSPPVRFGQKYRKYIEDSNLIDFALSANVLSIREGLKTGFAEYLEVADENSEIHKIAINKVVIACGGIENNRLLLWSQHLNKRLFSDLEIGKIDPKYLLEVLTEMNTDNAEALFISCTALPALEIIQELENKIKKIVLSSNQALIWNSIRSVGYTSSIEGYGELLKKN